MKNQIYKEMCGKMVVIALNIGLTASAFQIGGGHE